MRIFLALESGTAQTIYSKRFLFVSDKASSTKILHIFVEKVYIILKYSLHIIWILRNFFRKPYARFIHCRALEERQDLFFEGFLFYQRKKSRLKHSNIQGNSFIQFNQDSIYSLQSSRS